MDAPDPLKTWLLQTALPLWLTHGIDRARFGFHEHLAPGGYHCDAGFRRLRVAARQIFVYARAHHHGVPGADEAVALGIDFLQLHAALPEGGYAWRFSLGNLPIDTTRDLYDHAFVLLALASAASILPAAPLRARALTLLDYIDTAFADPVGGYRESLPPTLPRRQNPHMHLLEALLAAHEAFPDAPFLDRARALVELFHVKLFDPETGALPEFFDASLRPQRDAGAFLVEPGHHYEWVWLLHRANLLGAYSPQSSAAALMTFATGHGHHPVTNDVIDSVRSTGADPVLTARLWPQTERLKAQKLWPSAGLVTREALAAREAAATGLAAWLLPDGLWHERREADGTPIAGNVPASSLYHLTCAILADPVRG